MHVCPCACHSSVSQTVLFCYSMLLALSSSLWFSGLKQKHNLPMVFLHTVASIAQKLIQNSFFFVCFFFLCKLRTCKHQHFFFFF
uniref:Secreted protein n=1 Tax=Pyxicephalus adspersus TaxID=30357 RepID=A0AAV3ATC4_PYXAD|nr:TPA: hypothetical protein GDO54_008642 [Pyxicephalus adspersus]